MIEHAFTYDDGKNADPRPDSSSDALDAPNESIDDAPMDFRNQQTPESENSAEPETEPSPAPDDAAGRPEDVPEKFWDAETNAVNVNNLMKSYLALERKLGQVDSGVPASPDDYELRGEADIVDPDGDVNRRLHAAGFTNEQAQVVYDMAAEYVVPALTNVANEFGARAAESVLENHFGGSDKWAEAKHQIRTWAEAHLPEDFESMTQTVPGVLRVHAMMQKDEPDLLPRKHGGPGGVDEASLRQMMRDPKYWRDQDPAYVAQVRDGFQRLYPD